LARAAIVELARAAILPLPWTSVLPLPWAPLLEPPAILKPAPVLEPAAILKTAAVLEAWPPLVAAFRGTRAARTTGRSPAATALRRVARVVRCFEVPAHRSPDGVCNHSRKGSITQLATLIRGARLLQLRPHATP
jgi:hypothetical protein